MLSIGPLELVAIALVTVPTVVTYYRGSANFRLLLACFVFISLASIVTPADLLSTILVLVACLALGFVAMKMRPRKLDRGIT